MPSISCQDCFCSFTDTDEDIQFRERVSPRVNGDLLLFPPPRHCPQCRRLRRGRYANDYRYFVRACSLCNARVVSTHRPQASYPVYCYECWWGDGWSRDAAAIVYDPGRSFFEQFHELRQRQPALALINDNGRNSENCAYCQNFAFGKNCYLAVGSWHDQDCLYVNESGYCRDVVDCSFVNLDCEMVYESSYALTLYHCAFLSASSHCRDCYFGSDLRSCDSCFGCVGLRQKRYCIFNREVGQEEYLKFMAQTELGSYQSLCRWSAEFARFSESVPKAAVMQVQCEGCLGDGLFRCKNSHGFRLFDAENCRYYFSGDAPKNCSDIEVSGKTEWCYQGLSPDESYECHFTLNSWRNREIMYSDCCFGSNNLFGCVGMLRSSYRILNREFSPAEYKETLRKIYGDMQRSGEWGEFFPKQHSFYAYNESRAQELVPLTDAQAAAKGELWRETAENLSGAAAPLPEHINQASDDVCTNLFSCAQCRAPYKIVKQELIFLRKMGLSLPRSCPTCRRRTREKSRPMQLYMRRCTACNNEVNSVFTETEESRVLCEQCYIAEFQQ